MLKNILIGLGVLILLAIIAFVALYFYITPDKMYIANFLKNNPEKSSIYWIRNGKTMADMRSDVKFPLASTVKIIIAIEYARQAAAAKINPQEQIDVADLDLFYLPDTDGGAHPNWKEELQSKNAIINNKVALEEVAKGMIKFSSNANSEYLMMKLGLTQINANLDSLGLKQHDKIYPFVSALLVFSNDKPADKKAFYEQIKNLSQADYVSRCLEIHEKLKVDKDTVFKKAFVFPDRDLQKNWSDRLPAATAKEYVSIMEKMNSRTYFSPEQQANLDKIMEWSFEVNPKNHDIYNHLGMKGGSTAFILTNSLYAETKKGDKTSIALFFNNLTKTEAIRMEIGLNDFNIQCLGNKTFESIADNLSGK
jgi:D-alanyl-D-alanine carboxypeptidase